MCKILTTVCPTWNHLFNNVFCSLLFKHKTMAQNSTVYFEDNLDPVLSIGNKFKDPFSQVVQAKQIPTFVPNADYALSLTSFYFFILYLIRHKVHEVENSKIYNTHMFQQKPQNNVVFQKLLAPEWVKYLVPLKEHQDTSRSIK